MREREAALALLRKTWNKRPLPVDPVAVAEAVNVAVKAVPADESGGYSGYHISGPLPKIVVNMNEPETRRRFTVAHELGHYVLGHGERPRDGTRQFSALNSDPIEAAANRFAAELLMPYKSVLELVTEKGITSVSRLADIYKVSEIAMKYRLKNLGLIR